MRKVISIAIVLAMLLSICTFAAAGAADIKTWNFDTDKEGWTPQKGSLSVAGGIMTHTVAAGQNNAFLQSPDNLGIDGSVYKYVKVRLKNENVASNAIVVSFTTTSDTTFDTSYSTGTKTVITGGVSGNDSSFTEYVINMSDNKNWNNGTIKRMRILLFLNSTSIPAGSMHIDYIKVSDTLIERGQKSFYVSSSAKTNGDGSESSPWNTLDSVESAIADRTILPGDTVLLKCGDVFEENFVPTASADSESFITITSYGSGKKPVISPGLDAESPYAVLLDNVAGYRFIGLEICNARAGIRMKSTEDTGSVMNGLWIEDCYIHDIKNIVSPSSKDELQSDEYTAALEDEELYMSYAISTYKRLNAGLGYMENITVKNCVIDETDAPLTISWAKNVAVEDCRFTNSYKQGVLFSNINSAVTGNSYMKNCDVYNMGYTVGMYWGVAGVQFNTCKGFVMDGCTVGYTKNGGDKPDGVAVDFEGSNDTVTVQNCNFIGNNASGILIYENPKWGSCNYNISIKDSVFENNGLKTEAEGCAGMLRLKYNTDATGSITGNTVVLRNGQSLSEVDGVLTNDITNLRSFSVTGNTVTESQSAQTVSVSAPAEITAEEPFEFTLTAEEALSAEKTELYVDGAVIVSSEGFDQSITAVTSYAGKFSVMAKITLTDGSIIYSAPVTLTAAKNSGREKFAKEWIFDSDVQGWQSNKGAKTGSKLLYIEDGHMVYYLSDNTTASAHTNNFLLSPNNLGIYGAAYKYVKIKVKNTTNLAGNFSVSFTTEELTGFPSSWGDTVQTKAAVGLISANAPDYTEYVLDMSDVPAWTSSTITRMRIQANPYTITAGNAGDVLIEYIKVSNKLETDVSEQPEGPAAEQYAQRWSFAGESLGWASNKGAKAGSKPLYIDNGTMEYYLSDDSSEGANNNNFLLSPGGLAIDGSVYKYVKIKLMSDLPSEGDIGVQFTTAENTAFPATWTDTSQTVLMAGAMEVNNSQFREYIVDMSSLGAWTGGTVTRLRIRTNPGTISQGCSGIVHIASIAVSNMNTPSVQTAGIKYDWDFNIKGSVDSWQMSETKGVLSQESGKLKADITGSQAVMLSPQNLYFSGSEYPYIHIIADNTAADITRHKIWWTTEENASFGSDRLVDKTWNDPEGYVHYIYDMNEAEGWCGNNITRLQLTPASDLTSGTVYIERILISGDPKLMYEDNTLVFSQNTQTSVSCTAVIRDENDGSAVGVVALYDENGALIAAKSQDIVYEQNIQSLNNIELNIPGGAAVKYAKAFLWNSMQGIRPMAVSVRKNITEESLEAYAQPFWESELMVNESVTMIKGEDSLPAQAPLMYAPTEIISVRNSALDTEYLQGVDYVIEGNIIKLTENSRIKSYEYEDIYPSSYTNAGSLRKRVSGGYIYCPEGLFFHNGQLAVTYKHEADATFVGAEYQGDKLASLNSKLAKGEDVNVLLYGDSISVGANVSGKTGGAPWLPIYGKYFSTLLSEKTGSKVNFINQSKSGQTSVLGAENASAKISGQNPDLLIIAFGMNDGSFGVSLEDFEASVRSIISTAKSLYPECDIVLISTTLPNEEVYQSDGKTLFMGTHREQPAVLSRIAQDTGAAFVNVTAIHEKLLENKRFVDMTGNNTNHPNDFLARMYVQALMKTVTE